MENRKWGGPQLFRHTKRWRLLYSRARRRALEECQPITAAGGPPKDKIRIVLESINTNITLAELCRKYSVSPNAIYDWKEKFMEGGKLALSGALKDPGREKESEIDRSKKLIGEITIANDAMKKVLQGEGKK